MFRLSVKNLAILLTEDPGDKISFDYCIAPRWNWRALRLFKKQIKRTRDQHNTLNMLL